MEELNKFTVQELIDLLAMYTQKYTQYVAEKEMTSENYAHCKTMVKLLQSEIESRKHPAKNEGLILSSDNEVKSES